MDARRFFTQLPANHTAILLGFIWVLLGEPYVNLTPELPILWILLLLSLAGLVLWLLDRYNWYENEWSIRDLLTLGLFAYGPTMYWKYSNKFLGMTANYLSEMSRSILVQGSQVNQSHYPMGKLTLIFGGFILVCFLLVQNEFSSLARAPSKLLGPHPIRRAIALARGGRKDRIDPITGVKVDEYHEDEYEEVTILESNSTDEESFDISNISTSLFGIGTFLICYILLTSVLELSPGSQVPFFFLGGTLVAAILLLQDNIPEIMSIRSHNLSEYIDGSPKSIGAAISVLSIVLFAVITVNMSMFQFISQDVPAFLSLMTLLLVVSWTYILSQEGANPSAQSRRTAALGLLVLFPFVSYLLLRVIFLQNDGSNPVMLNRWEVRFDFMEKVNTFKINPWPMVAEPNRDARWLFLKAGIINSARATLVSIVLCTILGIIVGVTRLSTNKLASTAATVYVEVFRNLPLAVLLFLISTQLGIQLPMNSEETSLTGKECISENLDGECLTHTSLVYMNNQGTWFVTFASNSAVIVGIVGLALLRAYLRHMDRVQPRVVSVPEGTLGTLRRPFYGMGWRIEPLVADIFLIASALLCMFLLTPFIYHVDGDVQTLKQIVATSVQPLIGLGFLIYAFYVVTSIDDDGMNALEIDDSEEGVRKRFTIWVAGLAVATGVALGGGFIETGEFLSLPEYTKDLYPPHGVIDSPGSWGVMDGTGFEITPPFLAMIISLTLFTAATVAEIVRGSIQSLPRGQVEAAISLSLNPYQRLRLVILPQALRSMVPLMNNQFMNVWKNSSLAVVVAYTDIFYVILVMMNNVGKLIPLFLLLLVTYQAGSLTISAIMNWYNSRVTSVKI